MSAETFDLPTGVTEPRGERHPNYAPTPIVEISSHEFWHWFGVYGVGRAQEYRSVRELPGVAEAWLHSINIFWYHDRGMAVLPPKQWRCGDRAKGEPAIVYRDGPRFFYIGCRHDYKTVSWPNHTHHMKCAHCGFEQTVDTSG